MTDSSTPTNQHRSPQNGAVSIWPNEIWAYHATKTNIGDIVTSTGNYDFHLTKSEAGIDWLGNGIYLFPNLKHAIRWAEMGVEHWKWSSASIVKFSVKLGNCLDLTEYGATNSLIAGYKVLEIACALDGSPLPENTGHINGSPMDRFLDCAVLNVMRVINVSQTGSLFADDEKSAPKGSPFDTIICAFTDGEPPYPGAALRDKTHLQIAVLSQSCLSSPSIVYRTDEA